MANRGMEGTSRSMNNLQWKIRRLMAMSPAEIATRVGRMVRHRAISAGILKPYPSDAVECFRYAWREDAQSILQTFARRFPCARYEHDNWRELILREHPACAEVIRTEAEAILQGKLRILGFTVDTDVPPRWFRNYVQGGEWQPLPAERIDYRRGDVAGGVRYCWELNRHGYFLTLAQAWFLADDERFAQRLLTDWLDWIAHNPPRFGINWTSMLECALRVHTWCWTLWLLANCYLLTEEVLQRILGSLWQQTAEVAMNLSIGSSANNHLIGEAAGMWTFASLFPTARHARTWADTAHRILSVQIPRQITHDGVTVEQAIHYQVFVMEMALHALSLSQSAGKPFGEDFVQRLRMAQRFLCALMDCAGHAPQIGDSDDAEVLPFCPLEGTPEQVIADAVSALVDGRPPAFLKSAYLSAQIIRERQPSLCKVSSHLFAEGGYAVMRDEAGARVAVVDCGPLGWGSIAAHAHADALAVTLYVNGHTVLVDAGTYCYHDEPDWRDAFRSTRYHNTVCVDGQNQSEMLGAFLWGRRAHVTVRRWHSSELADLLIASHDGYSRIGAGEHIRWFWWLKPDLWLAVDSVSGAEGHRVEQCWCFSQACTPQGQGDRMQIRCADQVLWLVPASPVHVRQVTGGAPEEGGWVSPAFGRKEPCPHLFLQRTGQTGHLATLLTLGELAPEVRLWKDERDGWELQVVHLGRFWHIGAYRQERSWTLPDAVVTAKSMIASWQADGRSVRFEVIE